MIKYSYELVDLAYNKSFQSFKSIKSFSKSYINKYTIKYADSLLVIFSKDSKSKI